MYKAIIFDLGGVIYDHPRGIVEQVLTAIYNQSVEKVTKEYGKYRDDYYTGKLSTHKLVNLMSSAFKSNKSIDKIKNHWLDHYGQLAKPNQKVLEIIRILRKNYKVYLLSNTTEMSDIYNSKTGIYQNFDEIFLSFQMGLKKPNQEIYKKVISEVGVKPQECIFIDDQQNNLEVAHEVGIKTILFDVLKDDPTKLKEDLRKLKVRI